MWTGMMLCDKRKQIFLKWLCQYQDIFHDIQSFVSGAEGERGLDS